jgi:hypothetical protein
MEIRDKTVPHVALLYKDIAFSGVRFTGLASIGGSVYAINVGDCFNCRTVKKQVGLRPEVRNSNRKLYYNCTHLKLVRILLCFEDSY